MELTDNEQKDNLVTKKKMIDVIMSMPFVLLADFHKQMLLPGESLSLYVHQLKQLLGQAMPDIFDTAREQLLLYQFPSGLPQNVSKQLGATGATTTVMVAMQQARLLMIIEDQGETAAILTKQPMLMSFYRCSNNLVTFQNKWLHCSFTDQESLNMYEGVFYVTKWATFSTHVLHKGKDKIYDGASNLVMDGELSARKQEGGGCMGQRHPSQ